MSDASHAPAPAPLLTAAEPCARRRVQCNFDDDKLTENLMALTGTIEKVRPSGCKGKLWNTATLSSTMGPAIKLDLALIT